MNYIFKQPERGTEIIDILIGQTENDPYWYEIGKDKEGNFYWMAKWETNLDAEYGADTWLNVLNKGKKIFFFLEGEERIGWKNKAPRSWWYFV